MPWRVLAAIVCTFLHVACTRGQHVQPDIRSAVSLLIEGALDVYAPVSTTLGNSTCRTHSLLYRQGVKEGQLWALHMLDASSKLPSGLLAGNLVQFGNFDQCLAVDHAHPEHGPIRGQHCLVFLGAKNALSTIVMPEKLWAGNLRATGLEKVEELLSHAKFSEALGHVGATWSLCVPATCSAADLELHLRTVLRSDDVRVDERSCNSLDQSQPRTSHGLEGAGTAVVWAMFGCIGVILVLGTAYDLLTQNAASKGPRREYLLAFSLHKNGRDLLKVTSTGGQIACLDGLRCVTTFWVILFHHYYFSTFAAAINFRSLLAFERDWIHVFLSNGTLSVDSFFVISGALTSFNFLRDRERNVEFRLWRHYLNRYVRLTPTLLAAWLGIATFSSFSDSGTAILRANPIVAQEYCASKGWLELLYMSNYLDDERLCLGVSWSLSVEVQLLWVSPLLLFPLWRRPGLGLALLSALAATGTGYVFWVAFQNHLVPPSVFQMLPSGLWSSYLYFSTHTRATPWLIGLALGYFLHSARVRPSSLSRPQALIGWAASLAMTSYALLSAHAYFQPGHVADRLESALYVALMRPAWAGGVAWIIYACVLGAGGFLNGFLSWPVWQVPSRLCYATYLLHYGVCLLRNVAQKTPKYISDLTLLTEFFGVVVVSFALAVVVHLAIEVPSLTLYRLLFSSKQSAAKKPAETSHQTAPQ